MNFTLFWSWYAQILRVVTPASNLLRSPIYELQNIDEWPWLALLYVFYDIISYKAIFTLLLGKYWNMYWSISNSALIVREIIFLLQMILIII